MSGENFAFYGCSTSRKHELSLFKLPSARDDESEETCTLKNNARKAWLNLILRTRELTPDLKNASKRTTFIFASFILSLSTLI